MSWENYIAPVSASEINTEVGYSSTAETSLNDSRLRNLGRTLDNETEIEMKNLSFGLQLPLIEYDDALEDVLKLHANRAVADPGTAEAVAQIGLESSGDGSYFLNRRAGSEYTKNFTWLKIGSAGDYEAKLDINSGDNPTGASLGTWLNLGTNRLWTWSVTSTSGFEFKSSTGVISIRRGSDVGPIRHFDVDLTAEVT